MSYIAISSIAHATPFWERLNFWEGGAAAAVALGAINQWIIPPIRRLFKEHRNRNIFLDGREEIPNVANAILSASERMTEMDTDIKAHTTTLAQQSRTLKEHGEFFRHIIVMLEGIDKTTSATNERVADNGGDTSSLADVVQRVAKKMKVYDISATAHTSLLTGEEVVTELHALAPLPEAPYQKDT